MVLPQFGLTTGDPAGIGPEVSLRAAQEPELHGLCKLALFGDWEILRGRAAAMGIAFDFERCTSVDLLAGCTWPERVVVDVPAERGHITLGQGSVASGDAAARNIIECAAACKANRLQAIVTAPLSKTFLKAAGYPYPGHTEFLAHLAGGVPVAMAFLTDSLKVVLATIHLPLRIALEQISEDLILEKLSILLREFPRLGLPCRRVAVAGVNPHAGEGGLMGREEIERIEPAMKRARARYPDIELAGPLPADTLFYRAVKGEFDAVLALFHDQGLSPIKLMGFGEAVNVTLGLPFIRTSVDHGTAFDIAGTGRARHESMVGAIRWALRLVRAGSVTTSFAPECGPRTR